MKLMYDAAYPPAAPPKWPVVAGYIGGDTPHVWTDAEWDAQPAQYRLPIFVHTGPDDASAGDSDAKLIVGWLGQHQVPAGSSVVIDTETNTYTGYLTAMDTAVSAAGYKLVNYGSLNFVVSNPLTSGGRWTADWTGIEHIDDLTGVVATQWASATQLGTAYDASVCDDEMPLWDTKPPAWQAVAADQAEAVLAKMSALSALLQAHVS
jgi:hypothetical protein